MAMLDESAAEVSHREISRAGNSGFRLDWWSYTESDPGDGVFVKLLEDDNLIDLLMLSDGHTPSLWNVRPAPYGRHDIAEGLIAFFDPKGIPVGVEFFKAAEQALPALTWTTPSYRGRMI